MTIRHLLACLIACSICSIAHAQFEPPILITDATIYLPDATLESGDVLIEKGRIVAVGTDLTAPDSAQRVDATGLHVYAGFIDATSHAGISAKEPSDDVRKRFEDEQVDVKQTIQSATLGAYRKSTHPGWEAERLYDPAKAKTDAARKAGFTTALVAPKQALFAGRSAIVTLGDDPLRRSFVNTLFAQHCSVAGSWNWDQRGSGYPSTTMGTMAAFRQLLHDAKWYRELRSWTQRNNMATYRTPVDRDLEAMWDALDGKVPVAFHASNENDIHRALDLAAEFKLKPIICGGREAWRVKERLAAEDVPVIIELRWNEDPAKPFKKKKKKEDGEDPSYAAALKALQPVFDAEWEKQPWEAKRVIEERHRLWAESVDNAKALEEAGVRFAFGSFKKTPADMIKKLRVALKRGLSAEVALASLTSRAAQLLGQDSEIGSIQENKLANLTVTNKPFEDEKAKVVWVMVRGKMYIQDTKVDKSKKKKKGSDEEQEQSESTDDDDNSDSAQSAAEAKLADAEPADRADSATEETDASRSAIASEDDEDTADKDSDNKDAIVSDTHRYPDYRSEVEADRKPTLQTHGNILLKNAYVITVTGKELPRHDVLVRDGKIVEIGQGLSAPSDIKTIDLNGHYLTPGIIDAHSHLCITGGVNEATLSVTCEVRIRDSINHRDVGAFRALAGGVTTIHTMHGSANTIGGQNATVRLKYGRPASEWHFTEAPRTVKFALGENVKQSNWGSRGTRYPNTRMGVETVFRRAFDEAKRYQKELRAFQKAKFDNRDPEPFRYDLRLQTLSEILSGDIWVHTHCYRADEILRLLAVAEEYGFRIAVLQHILEGYRVMPEMLRHGCSGSTFSDWWAYKIEAYDAIPHNAARMHQHGIVTTVNSDSGEVIRHLPLEAAKSMRFGGLSANESLRLVTINAAIQLGVQDYVGSIEVGKFGDLAVFDRHPLDTFSKCVLTLIDGEVYFQHQDVDFAAMDDVDPPRTLTGYHAPFEIDKSKTGEYWITNATIHPVVGDVIESGTVIIKNGLIDYVGIAPPASPAPDEAEVLSVKGFHVYPGLISAGSSLGLIEIDSVRGTVDTSEIGRFQADLDTLSGYNPFSASIGVARSEGITRAMVLPGRAVVAGETGLVKLEGWSMSEAEMDAPAFMSINLPSAAIEYPRERTEEQLKRHKESKKSQQENLRELDKFFREAQHYAHTAPSQEVALDRQFEALRPYMLGKQRVLFQASSYKKIREALAFAETYDLQPVIFGGRDAWKLADELAEKKVDVIISHSMRTPRGFDPWDSIYRNAAELQAAGVRFCFATSMGDASLVKHLGIEAGMAVAHGLGEQQGLESITINAARILGLGEQLGSLETGKVADVIVCTDTPLQATNSVVAAFINGQPIDLQNKHTRMDDEFAKRPQPDLGEAPELRGPPAMRTR